MKQETMWHLLDCQHLISQIFTGEMLFLTPNHVKALKANINT